MLLGGSSCLWPRHHFDQVKDFMAVPIILPELGVRDGTVRISCWLVDLGDRVDAGDRVVEVLTPGITCDVSAPTSGTITRIEKPFETAAKTGEVLGWIEPDEDAT